MIAAALLALTGCADTRPAAAQTGTVTGLVRSSPSCPGPVWLDHPCPPKPVDGAVVAALAGAREVASTNTGSDGRFQMTLPAGRYLIRATNIGGYRSIAQRSVTVTPANAATVTLTLDTGMR